MPIDLAVSAPAGHTSRAPLGLQHDTSTHPPPQEQRGPLVILRVRALVPEKVKLRDPAEGTGQATVLAIDEEINQVKVQTEEGHRLMLCLDPASLARLHVGVSCLLQVAKRSTRDTAQPPEHAEAFW
jgi:hypothetical protein